MGAVRSYDSVFQRRAVHAVHGGEAAAAQAHGEFVRTSTKPTNHSKSTGCGPYKEHAKAKASKGTRKFRHDEMKASCIDYFEGDDDADLDAALWWQFEYER